jgi:DNA-binding transcriptional ArsR family regulator
MDDDQVFKALAHPTRRFLLDLLFQRDGRTLKELESGLAMTRFGVMKHLRVLEHAGLVVTRSSGREKMPRRPLSWFLVSCSLSCCGRGNRDRTHRGLRRDGP